MGEYVWLVARELIATNHERERERYTYNTRGFFKPFCKRVFFFYTSQNLQRGAEEYIERKNGILEMLIKRKAILRGSGQEWRGKK